MKYGPCQNIESCYLSINILGLSVIIQTDCSTALLSSEVVVGIGCDPNEIKAPISLGRPVSMVKYFVATMKL